MPSEAGSEPFPGPELDPVRIGVLAQQGDFASHLEHLASVGAVGLEVREPRDLIGLDGLILPGGESTTISKGLERDDLADRVVEFGREGRPILGTCAGMILLGRDHLGLLDVAVRRNAFGRQRASFEAELDLPGLAPGNPFPCIFIRAPWVERAGPGVEVLGELDEHPIAVRQGSILALSFHPELSDDDRIHGAFAAECREVRDSGDR
ncbi:MAG: pyridoxal 5'-phosphate synthase glutaminase subunit PdxT [Solirubrobacterales bacterium]